MAKKTTRKQQDSDIRPTLFMAFELGMSEWKLGFTIGLGQKARRRTITAGNLEKVQREIAAAKKRFELPETAEVVSCYEAGRDGFWLHRYLTQSGIGNLVVDSASIEVNRRKRRAKTDRLDVEKLLTMLIRYQYGEHRVWSVVRVPSPEEEDGRQLNRELRSLKKEKTRTTNRIKGLLASQGVRLEPGKELSDKKLDSIRLWDGSSLLPGLKSRLEREWAQVVFLKRHGGTARTLTLVSALEPTPRWGRPESARIYFATARIQHWVTDHIMIGTDRSFIRGLSPNQTPSHQLET